MRLQYISLGFLALRIGAIMVPSNVNSTETAHEVQRRFTILTENTPLDGEAPTVLFTDELEKRARAKTPPTKGKVARKGKPAAKGKKPTKGKTPANGTKTPANGKKPPMAPDVSTHKPPPAWPKKFMGGTCTLKQPAGKGKSKSPAGKAGGKSTKKAKTSIKSKARRKSTNLEKRKEKSLQVRGLFLRFPNYPGAGEVIGGQRYQTLVKTYGAVDPYGCNNKYGFQILPMPTHNTDAQNRPWGEYLERGDDWNTEHVLDAQVVGKFWEYIMDDQSIQGRIGRNVLTENGRLKKVTTEEWLVEFWNDRTDNGLSPMFQLLAEYPGTHLYTDELTLLGRHINNAKQSVFGGKQCISRSWWSQHPGFHNRIDQLRYCIFLSRYISQPTIADSIQEVSTRLTDKLRELEQPGGVLDRTRDYYSRKFGRDASVEYYRSLGLATKWETWVKSFVQSACTHLDALIQEKTRSLKEMVDAAKQLHEDTFKAFKETQKNTQLAVDYYAYSRLPRDKAKMEAWQDIYRTEKAQGLQVKANYEAIVTAYRALVQGTYSTVSPL